MPAAAVIPAPIAYIKVVAVKKLVVGFLFGAFGRLSLRVCTCDVLGIFCEDVFLPLSWWLNRLASFTVKKLECLKQAFAHLNTLAWNNKIRPWWSILLVCTPG